MKRKLPRWAAEEARLDLEVVVGSHLREMVEATPARQGHRTGLALCSARETQPADENILICSSKPNKY